MGRKISAGIKNMKTRLIRATIAAGLIAATAMPAAAQFQSHAYQFLKAVRDQDALKAKEFFDKPGSTVVNSRDYSTGETGLHIVVKRRDVPWINFLANAGANLEARDDEGRTPLILAAQLGFADGVRVLLLRGADPNGVNGRGETALIFAVQTRDATTVRALIDGGADPEERKGVAEGKCGSGRVDIGGRRIIEKIKQHRRNTLIRT